MLFRSLEVSAVLFGALIMGRTGAFFAGNFFAGAFLTGAFLTGAFFAAGLPAGFLAAGFLVTGFLAGDFFAAGFAAFFATFLRSFFNGTAAKVMRSGNEKPFRLTRCIRIGASNRRR